MKTTYRNIHLSKANQERLQIINDIIISYQRQGYTLTLRQLYYQLVSRDIIPNRLQEYSKLSTLLKEGRMSGIVDWDAIEDRLRKPSQPASWDSPEDIIRACADQFELPRLRGQDTYIETWVEKDALSGVLRRVTEQYHVPIVVNRGYSSVTAMHDAHKRFVRADRMGQSIVILYIGDFDPSGQDMIRDITDRINEFGGSYAFKIIPIALTEDQIAEHNPPPNPAKISDPRAKAYIERYGETSWEVDALRPEVLHRLLEHHITDHIDLGLYTQVCDEEQEHKDKIRDLIKYL